jgi:hypothetical protein
MDPDRGPEVEQTAPEPAPPAGVSRRSFLGDLADRAHYVAPVVIMLALAPRKAAAGASGCLPSGAGPYSDCSANEQCCTGNCANDPNSTTGKRCE